MLSKDVREILVKYGEDAKIFEEYDKSRVFALDKKKRTFNLDNETCQKLEQLSIENKQTMSSIITQLIHSA